MWTVLFDISLAIVAINFYESKFYVYQFILVYGYVLMTVRK